MSKKTVKILSILLTFIMVMAISTCVFAEDFSPANMTDFINTDTEAGNSVKNIGGKLIGMLQTAGVVIAIIIMIVIGIKYMMGSTADKAEYKKSLMPYFIGAILIFGAVAVSEMVFQLAGGLTTNA